MTNRQTLVATCPAGLGGGGLGQHLAQILSDARSDGFETRAICQGGVDSFADAIDSRWEGKWFKLPPFRFRADLRVWLRHLVFDRAAASRLSPCDQVTAFMGGALATFHQARKLGARRLILEMPNSHPVNVQSLHARAWQRHPIEKSWMGDLFRKRVEKELLLADEVRANSDYTAQSAIRMGVDPAKIVRRHLPPDPRFSRLARVPDPQNGKTAVMVGSLSVFKGVPFLVDIFRQIQGDDLRLVLFGGWSSRGMRQFLDDARRNDPRISWQSGDPATILSYASLAVHPSWEDGWGYAPAEALAVGVPVVVSDQTGMKELLPPDSDSILPAGDTAAWKARLERWASAPRP